MSQVLTTTVMEGGEEGILMSELPISRSLEVESTSRNAVVEADVTAEGVVALKRSRVVIIVAVLAGANFLSSVTTGFLTIGMPHIAKDIGLDADLISWYALSFLLKLLFILAVV